MDSKRRNAQEELERRENEAKKARNDENQAKAEYEAHLARLREEGAKRRQENWNSENIQKEGEIKSMGYGKKKKTHTCNRIA